MFYLCSRGIPEDVARRLVVRGFFGEILSKLPLPALRERPQDIPLLAESLLQRVAGGRGLVLAPAALRRLPEEQTFDNVQDVARALGIGTEQQRF